MPIFYTPSEKTRKLAREVFLAREIKPPTPWKELTKRYNCSRSWLAALCKWYEETEILGGTI